MSVRGQKKPARGAAKKRAGRAKAEESVVIDGTLTSSRSVKKTISITEEQAYKLTVLAAMSSLNGAKRDQSAIVRDALDQWFESNGLPGQYEVKFNGA